MSTTGVSTVSHGPGHCVSWERKEYLRHPLAMILSRGLLYLKWTCEMIFFFSFSFVLLCLTILIFFFLHPTTTKMASAIFVRIMHSYTHKHKCVDGIKSIIRQREFMNKGNNKIKKIALVCWFDTIPVCCTMYIYCNTLCTQYTVHTLEL